VESEKALYRQDPKLAGKPDKIVENALTGKLRKFYGDVCLVNQVFVKDDKLTVTQVVEATAKACGDKIAIRRFARFQLGAA
jgi:elongation factor Ts